jgi:putative flavoprotein involved in K+ transport
MSETEDWLARFGRALEDGDASAAAALFGEECWWRDLVAFTWNVTTLEGPGAIRDMLEAQLPSVGPSGWTTTEEPTTADGVTQAWIAFATKAGRGTGVLRLRDGKAWTLLTTLQELEGHEEPRGDRRPLGGTTWLQTREREARELGHEVQPEVVIVGGGQGGIALGARLRQLGVPTIIVDRHERPGDAWRRRYKTLCLHDPVWYDHLPYLPFPENWPVFSPKDKLADWLEMYARVMELNYWGSTEAKSATYDEQAAEWRLVVERDGAELTLRPRQLVFATGLSGRPIVPELPGQDLFAGEQHHSSRHPGPDAYRGKRAVVIGSNNSAHDIGAALWETGAEVTMVQRSSTHVVRADTLTKLGMRALYSEEALADGITTERADLLLAATPYRLLPALHIPLYERARALDSELYDRLEAAGFALDWGEDGSGLYMKYLRRGSGYYIDVGASELVANGDIRLRPGTVDHLTTDAVVMSDGTELPADLVVYATGYGPMNGWIAELVDEETAARVGKIWGLGSDTALDPGPWEGELRNMWRPTRQEALWVHGGNLQQARHYSLYLALQLKARMEGLDTPVYGLQAVHHPS